MAKSLRSKWRRKCRAVKRVRYGKKELEKLKDTILNDPVYKEPKDVEIEDTSGDKPELINNSSNLSEIITVVDKKSMKLSSDNNMEEDMETNDKQRKFNPRTLKDQHGTYPVWMNQRRIHKKKNLARAAEKKKRKLKKKTKTLV